MSGLSLTNASVTLHGVGILKSVSFEVRPGRLVALLGPNGAGKTTAVRALLGVQALTSGSAKISDQSPTEMTAKDRALVLSYLPQARQLAWPIAVREAVALGRFAYGGPLGRLNEVDARAIEAALARCDLLDFANRSVATLSGGELARVHLARAMAANAPNLIADEPIAALDPRHALEVLALLKTQASEGAAVLVILHDLTLASQFCDEVILMDKGQIIAIGTPQEALTPERIAEVYQVSAKWHDGVLQVLGRV